MFIREKFGNYAKRNFNQTKITLKCHSCFTTRVWWLKLILTQSSSESRLFKKSYLDTWAFDPYVSCWRESLKRFGFSLSFHKSRTGKHRRPDCKHRGKQSCQLFNLKLLNGDVIKVQYICANASLVDNSDLMWLASTWFLALVFCLEKKPHWMHW